MSLKKVVWYVLRVRNMHPRSPSDPSGTAVAEAKPRYLYVLDFKTMESEFQKAIHTATEQGEASYVYSILKPHSQSYRSPVRPPLSEAKPSFEHSILKPHGQSSKRPVGLLPCEAKLNYIHTILKKTIPSQSLSQAVVWVSTPRMNYVHNIGFICEYLLLTFY